MAAAALAGGIGLTAVGCARSASSPAPAPSAPSAAANVSPAATSASPAAADASPAVASAPPTGALPVALNSRRVGSRFIFLTKQKANRKLYVLRADSETGQYFGGNTGRSDFVNPHVTFYGRDGRQVVADAPRGTLVEKDKTVNMSGGVHARTADGKTLASDTMRYNDDTDTLYGEGDVVVTTPQGERLEGSTLVWNMHDGRLDVTGAR